MPETWWSDWCRRLNGYFGCETTVGEDGKTDGYSMSQHPALNSTNKATDTWFRFLVKDMLSEWVLPPDHKNYEWLKLNVFTRSDYASKRTVAVVFDAKPKVQEKLVKLLPKTKTINLDALGDPYFIHALFAEAVVALQEDAVWKIRNSVRRIEETRNTESLISHDLVRHAIHVFETLDLAAGTFNSMIEHHNRFAFMTSASDRTIINTQQHIHDRLQFFLDVIQGLRLRSVSNKERLLNEIQLSFNVVAQNINRAVQSDSSAMKTIALFTVALFPMPFLASVFSMSVFYYNDNSGQWSVSKKFWIYWAIAIPITLVVALLLYSYNKKVNSEKIKRL